MMYLAQFHSGSLAAAALIGLAIGWIAPAHRGRGLPAQGLPYVLVLIVIAIVLVAGRVVPGREGYWLDLGVLLLGAYLLACAVGTGLRGLLIAHQSRRSPPEQGV
jgi:hypothetical protein